MSAVNPPWRVRPNTSTDEQQARQIALDHLEVDPADREIVKAAFFDGWDAAFEYRGELQSRIDALETRLLAETLAPEPCGCAVFCGDDGDIDGPGTCKDLPRKPAELVEVAMVPRDRAATDPVDSPRATDISDSGKGSDAY